jgi:hypothetical protein
MRRSRASEARMVGESFELSIASCAQCRRLTCGKTTHHCDPRRPACFSTVIIGTLNRITGTLKPHYRYPFYRIIGPYHRDPRRPACCSTVLSREHRSTRCTGAVQQWTACMSGCPEDGRRGVSVKCASSAHGAFPLRQCRNPYSALRPWWCSLQSAAQSEPATALGWGEGCSIGDLDIACSGDAATLFRSAERVCCGVAALPRRARSWLAAYRSGPVAW